MVQFTEEKVLDPRAQELLQRVKYVHPESVEGQRLPEVVTVRLRDGRQYSHEVLIPKGAPKNPLTPEELMTKYRNCAHLVLSLEATERSLELVSHLEEVRDMTEMADLLTFKSKPHAC